ncbi:hypothetical protein BJ742DRAFT_482761 [Cladochytrium replicatum]|nr:hypothetical protein BJ742DRAFT_482761 [Cladochytrium replicatum]
MKIPCYVLDPSLCLDKSLVQRQLDVLDRFLKQSAHMKEGSVVNFAMFNEIVNTEHSHMLGSYSLIWTCESPLLSDRLGAFIKGYHNETDRLLNMRQQKEAHQEYTAEIQMGTVNGVRELATTTPDLKQGEPPQKPAESENKDDRLSAQERLDQLFKALLVKNPTTQSSRSISSSSLNSSVQPSNAQSSARSSRPSSASSRRGLERNAIALRNTNKMVRQAQSELQRLVQPQQPQMRHPSSALRLQPSQLINNRNTLPRGSLYPSETWLGLRAGAGGFEDGFYLAGQSIKGGSTLKLN